MEFNEILKHPEKISDISDSKELLEFFNILSQIYEASPNESIKSTIWLIIKRIIEIDPKNQFDTKNMSETIKELLKKCILEALQEEMPKNQPRQSLELKEEELPMDITLKSGKQYVLIMTSKGGICLNKKQ